MSNRNAVEELRQLISRAMSGNEHESLPKLFLPLIYSEMWLETYRVVVRNLSQDPDLCYRAVRFFYESLVPTVKRKVENIMKRTQVGEQNLWEVMQEVEVVEELTDGMTIEASDLPSDVKALLSKYGTFYRAMGKIRYRPSSLPYWKRKIAMLLYGCITRGLYEAGMLTFKTTSLRAG